MFGVYVDSNAFWSDLRLQNPKLGEHLPRYVAEDRGQAAPVAGTQRRLEPPEVSTSRGRPCGVVLLQGRRGAEIRRACHSDCEAGDPLPIDAGRC